MTGRPATEGDIAGLGWPADQAKVRHQARHQVMGLAGAFLLGMAVNLIGLPSQTTGAAHTASLVFLAMHVLIAAGLIIGAVMLRRALSRGAGMWRRQATMGAVAIGVTIAAGVLTTVTKSNWWSYAMAAGFLAALLMYGSLLVGVPGGDAGGDPVLQEDVTG